MQRVYVRPARAEDHDTFVSWALYGKSSELDPAIFTYKSSSVLCAYTKNGPLVFMPLQRPLHMESLVISPTASKLEVAKAIAALLQETVSTAYAEGRGEIYVVATEGTMPKVLTRPGEVFEKLPWAVYRLRVSDTEKASTTLL